MFFLSHVLWFFCCSFDTWEGDAFHWKCQTPLAEDMSTIEFSTKALKSHFQVHRLKLEETFKMGFSMSVRLRKPLVDDSTEAFFNSSMAKLSLEVTEEEFLEHLDQIMSQLNVFATGGSGWVVEKWKDLKSRLRNALLWWLVHTSRRLLFCRNWKEAFWTWSIRKTISAFCFVLPRRCFLSSVVPFDPKHIWKMYRSYISMQNKCPCHSLVFGPLKLETDAQ